MIEVGEITIPVVELGRVALADKSTEELIRLGHYGHHNSRVIEFCKPGIEPGVHQLLLVSVEGRTKEWVRQWMEAKHLANAYPHHLLSVGMHPEHRNLQLQYDIVCMGVQIGAEENVPYLGTLCNDRFLGVVPVKDINTSARRLLRHLD